MMQTVWGGGRAVKVGNKVAIRMSVSWREEDGREEGKARMGEEEKEEDSGINT